MRWRQLELMWGAGQVRRYHTLPTLRQQSVGEHTYGVLVFLNLLTGFDVSPALSRAALLHDTAEALTGDIPAPAKRLASGDGRWFRAAENEVMKDHQLLHHMQPLTEQEARLLKLADCLEGMRFCAQEVYTGNQAMRPVMLRFAEYAMEMEPLSESERDVVDSVLEAGGVTPENRFATRGCTCPRDEEGDIDQGFIERRRKAGERVRKWYLLVDPACPVHGGDHERAAVPAR